MACASDKLWRKPRTCAWGEWSMCRYVLLIALATLVGVSRPIQAGSWPQFRGPASSAKAVGDQKLPTLIGPEQGVIWKTPLPPGHSSPVVYGDRIYLTGVRGKALVTIGIDRNSGKVL